MVALVLLFGACHAKVEEPTLFPIVMVTLAGVRADVVGPSSREPSWTPRMNEVLASADFAGSAVVASSDPVASLASLLYGTHVWQHQVLSSERHQMPERRPRTLAERLREAGYRTTAYAPGWIADYGLDAGFDRVLEPLEDRRAASRVLTGLRGGDFVWIHLPDSEIVYGRHKPPRRSGGKESGQVYLRRLLAFSSPEVELPESERALYWRVYGEGLKRADRKLGWILSGLRKGPFREQALVVLTATHGLELGEHRQILYGMNLGRESIEVPLAVKLPDGPGAGLPAGRWEQTRIFATILEAAGRKAAPVNPPGFLRHAQGPILSELYDRNGTNTFSLLSGDVQLLWTARFATAEPDFYLARWVLAGGVDDELTRGAARQTLARLSEAFRRTPPLAGAAPFEPELRLERWIDGGGTEAFSDPVLARQTGLGLRGRFLRFSERERTPAEEERVRRKADPPRREE